MTVRTYYMNNPAWRAICERGRALREAAGTLTGHAAGDDGPREIDQAAIIKALGSAAAEFGRAAEYNSLDLPEPLKSVVDYLGETIDERDFVPTAELTGALDVEPSAFARDMAELDCRPTRNYITTDDGSVRRVRGYLTADIRAAVERTVADEIGAHDDGESEPS